MIRSGPVDICLRRGRALERAEEIPGALDRTFAALEGEGRQAVLTINVTG